MLTPKEKEKTIEDFKIHETDTGSSEVQIALLTEEIKRLQKHLKKHPKDVHSKRGLVGMVVRRKKFLRYLAGENKRRYNKVIEKIGLKK